MKYTLFSVNTSHNLTPLYEVISGKRTPICFTEEQEAIRMAESASKAWKAPVYIIKTIDYEYKES